MMFPRPKTLVQAVAALTMIGLTASPVARAADSSTPGTTTPQATTPCPYCPWARGPGMMGPGMMWNMTPEQREEHWRYMHQGRPYGRGMMGPGMMYGPWVGAPTPDSR
jgi:anaerobic selenocysteine-containing dehydrogenase